MMHDGQNDPMMTMMVKLSALSPNTSPISILTHRINTFNGDIQIPRKVPFSLCLFIPFLILSTLLTEIMKYQDPNHRSKCIPSRILSIIGLGVEGKDEWGNLSWIIIIISFVLHVATRQGAVDVY